MSGRRFAVVAGMVAVGIVLVLDLMWFFQGSLEGFPTGEQEDKVRAVAGGLAVVLVCVEVMLGALLWRLSRGAGGSAGVRSHP